MNSITSVLVLSALSAAAAPTVNSFDAGFGYGSAPSRVVKEIRLGSVNPTTASTPSNFLPVQTAIQYYSNAVYRATAPQYIAPTQQGYQPNLYAPLLQTSVVTIPTQFLSTTGATQTATIQLATLSATLSATTIAPAVQFTSTSTSSSQTTSSTPTTATTVSIPTQTLPPQQTATLPQQLLPTQLQPQYNPIYAQPALIYAQRPPVYVQPNAPYQAPPPVTSVQPSPQLPIQPVTAAAAKPVNLIPSRSSTPPSFSSSTTTTTTTTTTIPSTTCSETKAPAFITVSLSTKQQSSITTLTLSGMYIPPVPLIASTNQAGKSTKAYYTTALVPPAGLFVSSATTLRAAFFGAVAVLVMV
ncbi:hypothetical protein HDU81_007714 [Chytriomyces hyalinus]|nr:hypothetical protein HDU81_007714 [Chytriomyces hyalinus]